MAGTNVVQNAGPGVFFTGSFTLDPASVGNGASTTETVPIPEAKVGDYFETQPRVALAAGVVITATWISANGTASIRLYNPSAAPVDLASATWDYCITRGCNAPANLG